MDIYQQTFSRLNQSQQYVTCIIENGTIYQVNNLNGDKFPIGVDNITINDALALGEQYYNRLVELGDIVEPKTQDEINQELLETIKMLTDKLESMEVKGNGSTQQNSTKPSGKNAGNKQPNGKPSHSNE